MRKLHYISRILTASYEAFVDQSMKKEGKSSLEGKTKGDRDEWKKKTNKEEKKRKKKELEKL